MSDNELLPGFLVYAGRSDNAKTHIYYKLIDIRQNDGNSVSDNLKIKIFISDKKLFKIGGIGAVYDVHFKNDFKTVSYDETKPPVGYWDNETDLVKWKLNDVAAETIKQIEKKGAKNHLYDSLKPIQQAYRLANTNERRAMIAEVLRIITSN